MHFSVLSSSDKKCFYIYSYAVNMKTFFSKTVSHYLTHPPISHYFLGAQSDIITVLQHRNVYVSAPLP